MKQTIAGQTVPNMFGPCCACGRENGARNIILLDRRAPQPGPGWGCFQCGLPQDGAIALVCDDCLQTQREICHVIDGRLVAGQRLPLADLPDEPFTHDPGRHPELGQNN